ncbi:MAG: AraC family transcriptional regulator [Candidatus Saccharimonadaceae bacterium]|nr:AraC family transcriptional regulator [Candidatus Saccharimonadaceae bacterium]
MDDFSIISENLPVKVKLALLGYGVVSGSKFDYWHEHKYWQAEFPVCGRSSMKFYGHTDFITAGDILLIPPMVRHSFEYCDGIFSTWSLKFNVINFATETELRLLKADEVTKNITSLLDATIRQQLPETSPDTAIEPMHPKYFNQIAIIEHLLAGIISYAYETKTNDTFEPGKRIRRMVAARHGGNVTVEEAAKKLGYTRGHLSFMFKQHYGISLKQFIDRERVETAKRLLEYSDMNIGGIADIMGFPDIFSFSSFFKRQTGIPPSHYLYSKTNH